MLSLDKVYKEYSNVNLGGFLKSMKEIKMFASYRINILCFIVRELFCLSIQQLKLY